MPLCIAKMANVNRLPKFAKMEIVIRCNTSTHQAKTKKAVNCQMQMQMQKMEGKRCLRVRKTERNNNDIPKMMTMNHKVLIFEN